MLRSGLTGEISSRSVLSKTDWSGKVYGAEIIATSGVWTYCGWGHMGQMEARVVLKGDLCVAGLPTDANVGANYKDKRNAVFHMAHQELHNLIVTKRVDGRVP